MYARAPGKREPRRDPGCRGVPRGEGRQPVVCAGGRALGREQAVRVLARRGPARRCGRPAHRRQRADLQRHPHAPERPGKREPAGDEEEVGEETEFGMVDAKEREGINEWVRSHRHLFGRAPGAPPEEVPKDVKMKVVNSGPYDDQDDNDGSDSEDDDFSASVSDLDGSERSTDGDSSDEDASDKEGNGNDSDADAEGSEDDLKEEEEEEEELDPAHHPLLRPWRGAQNVQSRSGDGHRDCRERLGRLRQRKDAMDRRKRRKMN